MDRFLRPERFSVDPSSSSAKREWTHWYRTFVNFLAQVEQHQPDKLNTLINHISPSIYEYISDCVDYESSVAALKAIYVKEPNEVYARYILATRQQQPDESLDKFLQALNLLSNDCKFKPLTAKEHKDIAIRDAFISGLKSTTIRQRLLENKELDLENTVQQARCLEIAQKNSESYNATSMHQQSQSSSVASINNLQTDQIAAVPKINDKCFFCGAKRHP